MFLYMDFVNDCHESIAAELESRGHRNVASLKPVAQFALLYDNGGRLVPERRYMVHMSDTLASRTPAVWRAALDEVTARLSLGQSINPYLSGNTKRVRHLDRLLLHWGINHLHLESITTIEPSGFVKRSDYLLFFRVHERSAYLIDVRRHDAEHVFVELDLVETADRNWPHLHHFFRGKAKSLTREEHDRMRKANVMVLLNTARGMVMPTSGVSASGHSISAVQSYDQMMRRLRQMQRHVQFHYETLFPRARGWVSSVTLAGVAEDGFHVHDGRSGKHAFVRNQELDG